MLEPLEASSSGFLSTQPTQMVLQPAQNQESRNRNHTLPGYTLRPWGPHLQASWVQRKPATIQRPFHQELPPRIFGRYGSRRPLGCDQLPWDRNSRAPADPAWDEMGQGALLTQTQQTLLRPSKSCHDQDTAPPPSVRLRLRFRRRPRLPGNSIRGHAVLRHAWKMGQKWICKLGKLRINIEIKLESRRRRTKGSVVGEEWCQNAAPLRW